jgi:hypothetical protein
MQGPGLGDVAPLVLAPAAARGAAQAPRAFFFSFSVLSADRRAYPLACPKSHSHVRSVGLRRAAEILQSRRSCLIWGAGAVPLRSASASLLLAVPGRPRSGRICRQDETLSVGPSTIRGRSFLERGFIHPHRTPRSPGGELAIAAAHQLVVSGSTEAARRW